MKIYKKCVKNKEYLIATDRIYINKGKSTLISKSLGPADSTKNLAYKKLEFINFVLKEEARLRNKYWKKCVNSSKFTKYASIEKIEKLRSFLYNGKKNMGEMANSAMEMAFLIDFIYNSNKIEGSRIPRSSVEKIVKEGKGKKSDEVSNTIKAINYIDNKFTFSVKQIEKLHSIILAHEPGKLGIRKEKIIVGNSGTINWTKIKPELSDLLNKYKTLNYKVYPPELAFYFYYNFERIHPFVDGNGRTGRLLMNKILKDHRYHPIIVWNKRRAAHLSAFEKSMEGRSELYYKFMAD